MAIGTEPPRTPPTRQDALQEPRRRPRRQDTLGDYNLDQLYQEQDDTFTTPVYVIGSALFVHVAYCL